MSRADSAVWRQRRGFGRHDHAGQRVEPIEERPEETLLLGRGRVLAPRQRQARHQDVRGVQPEIDRLQRDEAAHEQPRADQQHQRQRDFDDDEHAAEPAAAEAAADAFAGVLERLDHVAPGRLQRRDQPEEQRRQTSPPAG